MSCPSKSRCFFYGSFLILTIQKTEQTNQQKKDEHTIYMTSLQIYKIKIHGISWRFFFFFFVCVCVRMETTRKIQPNEISEFDWIEWE